MNFKFEPPSVLNTICTRGLHLLCSQTVEPKRKKCQFFVFPLEKSELFPNILNQTVATNCLFNLIKNFNVGFFKKNEKYDKM